MNIDLFVIVALGVVLGSFSTALIYRAPKRKTWAMDRSACPKCKVKLGAFDLIPVLSWLVFKGKCRHCRSSVSWQYPAVEMASALLCVGVYLVFGFSYESFLLLAAIPILVALFVIDLKHMILPNHLVFILMVLGLLRLFYFSVSGVFVTASDMFVPYFLGALLYAGLSWFLGFTLTKVLKKDSLGFGDVKFFFVAGLWLGLTLLPHFMILSGGIALVFALCWRMITKEDAFPFGPALITSFYILLLFQGSFFR